MDYLTVRKYRPRIQLKNGIYWNTFEKYSQQIYLGNTVAECIWEIQSVNTVNKYSQEIQIQLKNKVEKYIIRSHLVQKGGWDGLPDVTECGRTWSHLSPFIHKILPRFWSQNFFSLHITAHLTWNVEEEENIFQCWYWIVDLGMPLTCLRDALLWKLKARKNVFGSVVGDTT